MDDTLEEHPILTRDIIRSDGSHSIAFRVFCPSRGQSVPVSACETCPGCVDITADGDWAHGCVRCVALPVDGASAFAEAGNVGGLLNQSILCVGSETNLASVVALFVERALAAVFVVDDEGGLLGLIREVDLVRARVLHAPPPTAGEIMSTAIAVDEDTPVRRAIQRMAASHLRDVAVVTRSGMLVGVLRDLEALRWITAHGPRR